MPIFTTEYPQFLTASLKGWYKLLEPDQYKDIIVNSLRFLVEDKRIKLYAFVIMFNLADAALNESATCAEGFSEIYCSAD